MEMLKAQWVRDNFVCVGLDSDYDKIPESVRKRVISTTIADFNQAIVEATSDLVCAFKPNIAFYEAFGSRGFVALKSTVAHINRVAPEVPVILDAKRADIGNTNKGYVKMAFEYFGVDAITVHPYLGREALQPFLDMENKGIFVLCRTSNPGAGELQDLCWSVSINHKLAKLTGKLSVTLFEQVADNVTTNWNNSSNCGLVVGATYPAELQRVRQIVDDMPILIPGVGKQTEHKSQEEVVGEVVATGMDSQKQGIIINSSRGIIFASSGDDFAEAARRETIKLRDMINQYRKQKGERK